MRGKESKDNTSFLFLPSRPFVTFGNSRNPWIEGNPGWPPRKWPRPGPTCARLWPE